MASHIPNICVIDEIPRVKFGWQHSLGSHAKLYFYQDHRELFKAAGSDKELLGSFACVIIGRLFSHLGLDIVQSEVPTCIRARCHCPIFLNWQGYIAKNDLDRNFDGKVFQRYGVKWHTLRLRLQRLQKKNQPDRGQVTSFVLSSEQLKISGSKAKRCQELLMAMARRAEGDHRQFIEACAYKDLSQGIELLEAIYNRLITYKDRPENCPSRYINSSPIIAARILQEALYDASFFRLAGAGSSSYQANAQN